MLDYLFYYLSRSASARKREEVGSVRPQKTRFEAMIDYAVSHGTNSMAKLQDQDYRRAAAGLDRTRQALRFASKNYVDRAPLAESLMPVIRAGGHVLLVSPRAT